MKIKYIYFFTIINLFIINKVFAPTITIFNSGARKLVGIKYNFDSKKCDIEKTLPAHTETKTATTGTCGCPSSIDIYDEENNTIKTINIDECKKEIEISV